MLTMSRNLQPENSAESPGTGLCQSHIQTMSSEMERELVVLLGKKYEAASVVTRKHTHDQMCTHADICTRTCACIGPVASLTKEAMSAFTRQMTGTLIPCHRHEE